MSEANTALIGPREQGRSRGHRLVEPLLWVLAVGIVFGLEIWGLSGEPTGSVTVMQAGLLLVVNGMFAWIIKGWLAVLWPRRD